MTPEQFERQIKKDLAALRKSATQAIASTAQKAVRVVQKNAPHAFGDLRDSTSATSNATKVTAPHAQAVEVGARPHLVPLEELIKWVKLRGMQGLSHPKSDEGPTTREHATRVAGQLQSMESDGALSVNAPEKIAKAIQMSILKNGIHPTWFVQKSLPEVMTILDIELKKVFQ